jgi:hypothetical protein
LLPFVTIWLGSRLMYSYKPSRHKIDIALQLTPYAAGVQVRFQQDSRLLFSGFRQGCLASLAQGRRGVHAAQFSENELWAGYWIVNFCRRRFVACVSIGGCTTLENICGTTTAATVVCLCVSCSPLLTGQSTYVRGTCVARFL